eukprot:439935_1
MYITWEFIGAWVSRIVYFIAIMIVWKILKREQSNRSQDSWKQQNDKHHANIYQKWLNICSSTTIVLAIFTLAFYILETIPIICLYTYPISSSLWPVLKSTLTLYQISRLQYCFYYKQIHSIKHGYSSSLFIAL